MRSSDFAGGNIPNCLNVPSRTFDSRAQVGDVIKKHVLPRKDELRTVVCHCMRSQMRGALSYCRKESFAVSLTDRAGPYAAEQLKSHPDWPPNVDVQILDGGFLAWRKAFKGNKEGLWDDGSGSNKISDDPEEEQHSKEIRSRLAA